MMVLKREESSQRQKLITTLIHTMKINVTNKIKRLNKPPFLLLILVHCAFGSVRIMLPAELPHRNWEDGNTPIWISDVTRSCESEWLIE